MMEAKKWRNELHNYAPILCETGSDSRPWADWSKQLGGKDRSWLVKRHMCTILFCLLGYLARFENPMGMSWATEEMKKKTRGTIGNEPQNLSDFNQFCRLTWYCIAMCIGSCCFGGDCSKAIAKVRKICRFLYRDFTEFWSRADVEVGCVQVFFCLCAWT